MNLDALIQATNYDPEATILKPIKFVLDMAMLALYLLLGARSTLRLFRVRGDSVSDPVRWIVYYPTEPFMAVVRAAFPKVDNFLLTLLPLLTTLTVYGADLLLNLAFRLVDQRLVG